MDPCDRYREAVSALLDGEDAGVPDGEVVRHLAGCTGCTGFAARADRLRRRVRLAVAEPVPDLSGPIVAHAAVSRTAGWRWLLALTGLALVVTGAGDVVAGLHHVRDLGLWEVALGGGLLAVARRPAYGRGLLPVVAVLAVAGVVGAVAAVADGAAPLREVGHLLPAVATVLLAGPARGFGRAADGPRPVASHP